MVRIGGRYSVQPWLSDFNMNQNYVEGGYLAHIVGL